MSKKQNLENKNEALHIPVVVGSLCGCKGKTKSYNGTNGESRRCLSCCKVK